MGAEKITITAEKGRLSEEEIERMVQEAEQFAQEDAKVKERIDAKNGLESYLYNLKNTLDDDEKGLADKLSEEDKEELTTAIDEAWTGWMRTQKLMPRNTGRNKRRSSKSRTPSCAS